MPWTGPLAKPALRSISKSTREPSEKAFKETRLTAAYTVVCRALLKPRLGMRRISGICPPSKPMRMELPERAVWPLPPRPLVLPWPLDSPEPSRLRRCFAPGRGLKSCKRIKFPLGDDRGCRRWQRGRLRDARRSDGHAAAAINILAHAQLEQRVQSGLNHVGRVF